MSLLMEALRKAEEAKSKAAKEDQENGDNEETLDSSVIAAPADLSPDPNSTEDSQPQSDAETLKPIAEDGPVVIKPEPDEIETLASHTEDQALADSDKESLEEALPSTVLSLEPIPEDGLQQNQADQQAKNVTAKNTADSIDPEPPIVHDIVDDIDDVVAEDEDDGLSLLESSYFSRTKKPGRLGITDDDLEDMDYGDTVDGDNESAQPDLSEAADNTESAEAQPEQGAAEYSLEEITSETDRKAQVATADARAKEQEKRSSAGALFLAKQQSQKGRWRKLLPIAAVLLVIPVAGAMYWFYTSFNSAPGMQFNIPAGGLADRGGLGNEGQPGNTQLSQDGNSTDQVNQPEATGQLANEANTAANNADSVVVATGQTQFPAAQDAGTNVSIAAAETTPISQQPEAVTVTPPVQPPLPTPAATTVQDDNAISFTSTPQPQGLSFVRTQVVNVVNPDLNAAYDSYQQGDLVNSNRLYQQALNSEPNNRDALLGLASVYLKQNNIPMSQNLYARLLELNPRDPIARAGLLETSLLDDPGRQETELKSLISAYPGVAPLSFALGNLYAMQNRWNEAQNAYFSALLTAKSSNAGGDISPDYAFNLAVSLERLNQLQAALDYYREAEEFSQNAIPGFDTGLLNQRMNYLEQQLP